MGTLVINRPSTPSLCTILQMFATNLRSVCRNDPKHMVVCEISGVDICDTYGLHEIHAPHPTLQYMALGHNFFAAAYFSLSFLRCPRGLERQIPLHPAPVGKFHVGISRWERRPRRVQKMPTPTTHTSSSRRQGKAGISSSINAISNAYLTHRDDSSSFRFHAVCVRGH